LANEKPTEIGYDAAPGGFGAADRLPVQLSGSQIISHELLQRLQ